MDKKIVSVLALIMFMTLSAYCGDIKPQYLRCEYLVDPLGIDIDNPRLSWIVTSDKRAQVQTYYHIIVSSSRAKLDQNHGDLWDTGKVKSVRTSQIEYKGNPLKSHGQCFWKVMVWDRNDQPSGWSSPAVWTMSMMDTDKQWTAKWIGFDASRDRFGGKEDIDLSGAKWIWYPEGNPAQSAPVGRRLFRKTFVIPDGRKITRATCVLTADDGYEFYVNHRRTRDGNTHEQAFIIDVTDRLKNGENILGILANNAGSSANPAGVILKLKVDLDNGKSMTVISDDSWISSDGFSQDWMNLGINTDKWKKAKELGNYGVGPWNDVTVTTGSLFLPPAQYLRKDITLAKEIKRAVVYASALGNYRMEINGSTIGEDYFTPGWTDYSIRIYYNTYDVTGMVKKGRNSLGAILADGWYSGFIGWGTKRDHYGKNPRFSSVLYVEYTDGTSEIVNTDKSWKASTGPILYGDFLMGEMYDARKELNGWSRAGYDDSAWKPVDVTDKVDIKIQAYPSVTVKKFREIKAMSVKEPAPGSYVFDMGTNFAGNVRLKVKGKPGQQVVIRFAERLNEDGTIYTTNLRGARATDTYICKSSDVEIWQPRFTFHGFQYVEVTGIDKPGIDTVTGIELTSATPVVGSFECNDEVANQLYKNICQTQRANFIDIPTDCPQRDERLGWMGDAQIYVRSATNNTDVSAFFTKWLVDVEDAQLPNGAFTDVSPRKVAEGGGTAAWGDAGVICPWTIYQIYGDKRVLAEHYDAMVRWVEYCKKNSKDLLRPASGYGDWLSINADTPKDVLATAYFAYSTYLTAETAIVLDKYEEAMQHRKLFNDIKKAFNKAYVRENGRIKGDTQTVYVMAIAFRLLSEDKQKLAEKYLVEDIQKKGWLISTGFVGTKDLMMTLQKINRLDVAYRLFHNDVFPSWGFSIKHGATSIWERWDGWTPEKGFQNPGMNSFAHYSFGAVCEWMFKVIGGIDTIGHQAYRKIWIRPRPGGNINRAKVTYDSINGLIGSEWTLKNGVFKLKATVPANTIALVYIPVDDEKSVSEKGNFEGARFLEIRNGSAAYRVESGVYEFTAKGVKPIEAVK